MSQIVDRFLLTSLFFHVVPMTGCFMVAGKGVPQKMESSFSVEFISQPDPVDQAVCLEEKKTQTIVTKKEASPVSKNRIPKAGKESLLDGDGIQLLYTPKPKYPLQAREEGIEGTIYVQVEIDDQGHVVFATIVPPKGPEILEKSALETLKTWVFSGNPGGNKMKTIPVAFKLEGDEL